MADIPIVLTTQQLNNKILILEDELVEMYMMPYEANKVPSTTTSTSPGGRKKRKRLSVKGKNKN